MTTKKKASKTPKKETQGGKTAEELMDSVDPNNPVLPSETADPPAPAKKETASETKEKHLKSTFQHAVTATAGSRDGKLREDLQSALADENYSSSLAAKAADAIENENPSGNQWLIDDLRKI